MITGRGDPWRARLLEAVCLGVAYAVGIGAIVLMALGTVP